jgi:hypothetical protein
MILKPPYFYFDTVGNTDYYYLKIDDVPYTFLSAWSFELIQEQKKRLFMKPKMVDIEVPVAQKTMPLTALVIFTMFNSLMLSVKTYELDVDSKKIDVYHTWSEHDIEDMKQSFKTSVMDAAGKSNYEMPYTVKNPVAKGFTKDGYDFLAIEHNGAFHRTYWLVKTTKYGALSFAMVTEAGTEKDSATTSSTVMLLDRNLVNTIIEDYKREHLKDVKPSIEVKEATTDEIASDKKLN